MVRQSCVKMLWVMLVIAYSLPVSSLSQVSFERTYGGSGVEQGFSVQQTSDGGYIIVGNTDSFGAGSNDVYLIRTDSLGDTLWTRTYGGTASDGGSSVQQTSDGGYIITGTTESFGAGLSDVYLIKIDFLGDTLWTRTYGGPSSDGGNSVQQTTDGGYIIVGQTSSFGVGGDVYLIKTDSLGNALWTRTYGGPSSDGGNSVQQTTDGGYIIVGQTSSFGVGGDVYLIKTGSLGQTLWTKTYGGTYGDYGRSVQQTTPDGGYIITGSFGASGMDNDVYLLKTDSLGNTLWTRTYGRTGGDLFDAGNSVQQTSDGGYIIAGSKQEFTSSEAYLIKTDSLGDSLWTRTYRYGSNDANSSVSVQQTSDGGYIIAGSTSLMGGDPNDVYLIKTVSDLEGPILLSAVASDNVNPVPGIDDDDFVLITFNEFTNKPNIDAANINNVLVLSGGHTWTDGSGAIGGAIWNAPGDELTILLSTTSGLPRVAVGDTITPDGVTILDQSGNPAVTPVVITGSFGAVGIEEEKLFLHPSAFSLSQNHPNPFHHITLIVYALPEREEKIPVRLEIYDLTGRLVETLVDAGQKPGVYQIQWEGKDQANGVYFYRLQSGDFTSTMKMILLR